MTKFVVTVTTATQRIRYQAIASSSWDVVEAANDRYGICGVTVQAEAA